MNANKLRPLIFAELRKIAPELEEGDVAPDKLLRDQVDLDSMTGNQDAFREPIS